MYHQLTTTGQAGTDLKGVELPQPTNNVAATAATVTRMAKIVRKAKSHGDTVQLARSLVRHVPNKDWAGEVKAIRDYVRNGIRYTRDPHGVETIQTPMVTVKNGHGDCDDHAILVASLLAAIGHPVRIRAIKVKNNPYFCHVFAETKLGNKWCPVETTEPWEIGEVSPRVDMKGSIVRYG